MAKKAYACGAVNEEYSRNRIRFTVRATSTQDRCRDGAVLLFCAGSVQMTLLFVDLQIKQGADSCIAVRLF